MKLLTVVGARPQFVKASALSRVLPDHGIDELLVHTGQHHDDNMSQVFFDELGIKPPDFQLNISGGLHGDMTGRLLIALEPLLREERPDALLVYGDTNSTLAGALAASKMHIPVVHVEAGLRSFNRRMPEELNRIVTDHLSSVLYCPTNQSVENLRNEGISHEVNLVGDIMFDVALRAAPRAEQSATVLGELGFRSGHYVLATVHRQENADNPARLRKIMDGLAEASARMSVILPVHPRTKKNLMNLDFDYSSYSGLTLIDPVGYLDMIQLERNAALIVTDSGGVQKEAYFFQVPCLTLRGETEWAELVKLGWNTLLDVDSSDISTEIANLVGTKGQTDIQPYGTGNTAYLVAAHLASKFT